MISLENLKFDYEGSAEFKHGRVKFKLCLIDSNVADDFSGIFISPELGEGLFKGKRTDEYLHLRTTLLGVREEFDLQFGFLAKNLDDTKHTIVGKCISNFPNSSYITGVEQITLEAKLKSL